jgi:hypothetical protein
VRYRRRLISRRTRRRLGAAAGGALAVVVIAHAAGGSSSSGSTATVPAQEAAVPASAGSQSPAPGSAAWASAFLAAIPEPQTACNLAAVEAWEAAEGGGVTNNAAYNPLNTTQPEPGSWAINAKNVQAYPSSQEGLDANVTAITNGLYGGVLSALQAGNSAQQVADAVASSPWGTAPFDAAC